VRGPKPFSERRDGVFGVIAINGITDFPGPIFEAAARSRRPADWREAGSRFYLFSATSISRRVIASRMSARCNTSQKAIRNHAELTGYVYLWEGTHAFTTLAAKYAVPSCRHAQMPPFVRSCREQFCPFTVSAFLSAHRLMRSSTVVRATFSTRAIARMLSPFCARARTCASNFSPNGLAVGSSEIVPVAARIVLLAPRGRCQTVAHNNNVVAQ
jgi:hypothetical protein